MAERTGLRPDLVTYGKIIGGGFPVGAYGGRADLMDWVAPQGPVYQAGTLSANPVAMASGLAMLRKLKRENPYLRLEQQTEELALSIEKVGQEMGVPLWVQRASSLFWIVFGNEVQSIKRPEQIPAEHRTRYAQLFHLFLEQGIYLPPSAFEVAFLSTAHQEVHLEKLVAALRAAVGQLTDLSSN
jgi:glutamate-1-semialdehyde 2,1-aminomutase